MRLIRGRQHAHAGYVNEPSLYIGSYYRQPSSEDLSPLNALDESISKLTNRQSLPNIILAGDFNLPDINWMDHIIRDRPQYSNTLNQRVIDMSKDNCLHQMTDEPTRNDNILDLVMTTNQDLVNDLQIEPGMSDHEIVIANINIGEQRQGRPERTVYQYKKGNMDGIRMDMKEFSDKFCEQDHQTKDTETHL